MSKRIRYTDEPLDLEVVGDFLPPPEDLVRKEPTVKITLGLSRPTVDFFKRHARRNGTRYQRMIRRVLDLYASKYQRGVTD
jgi:predicted DNA binding CopG/RHH family protein